MTQIEVIHTLSLDTLEERRGDLLYLVLVRYREVRVGVTQSLRRHLEQSRDLVELTLQVLRRVRDDLRPRGVQKVL